MPGPCPKARNNGEGGGGGASSLAETSDCTEVVASRRSSRRRVVCVIQVGLHTQSVVVERLSLVKSCYVRVCVYVFDVLRTALNVRKVCVATSKQQVVDHWPNMYIKHLQVALLTFGAGLAPNTHFRYGLEDTIKKHETRDACF